MKKIVLKPFFTVLLICVANICQSQTDVLTQHNDLSRTGWNPNESILNTSNVTPTNFGILYKHTVDDQIFAQPLIATGISVTDPNTHTQVIRNLLIVVTVKNTMYAFDADNGTLNPYWQINFTPAGEIAPNAGDVHAHLCNFTYTDFKSSGNNTGQIGSFGTVGTPVIDKSTNTIYFVSRYRDQLVDNTPKNTTDHVNDPDWSSAGFYQQVHALDLSTGTDKFGSPVLIDPTTTFVNGTGPGNVGNLIYFDPRRQNQRGGLFISNGIVYIPYSGHCDMDNYHGWILGYKTSDLSQQLIRYVTTPNDERGGIWMSGAAPAVDAAGNIYFATGNGNNASLSSDPQNVALSVVKTTPDLVNHTLTNISWYKPVSTTYNAWNISDLDFGTGVTLIPGTNMLVTAHKSGILMLLSQNIPAPGGEYNESSPNFLGSYNLGAVSGAQSHSSLTYFGGATTKYIYQFSENTHLMAYPVNTSSQTLGTAIQNTSVPVNTIMEGGYSSVSSNGTDPSTAILWVTQLTGTGAGTIHALKADDITQELWNSDGNPNDILGNYAKMSPPTIANGKVYVSTFSNALNVYGLLSSNDRCINNVALNKTAHFSANTDVVDGLGGNNAFDGNTATRWAIQGNSSTYLYVDLGSRYDICKIALQWNNNGDNAKGFTIDITDDTLAGWTTINTMTGNIFANGDPTINTFNENTTARYVRMSVTTAGTFGVSISEFQVFGSPANNCISPALNNMTVTNITENSATLGWTPVSGITNYIVKYKPNTVSSYVTRNIQDLSGSGNPLSVNIVGLSCGFGYEYDIQSDCGSGKLSTPNIKLFTTSNCSSPCLNLTRWYNADLGDVQVAGKTCYSEPTPGNGTFTISGAGNGMAGNGDQFQFNYTNLYVDEEYIASIASQDALPATNQAGIMIRDSLTDISRFIFVGKTGNNQLAMIYRSAPGGLAVSLFAANATNANFFRIVKSGTTYAAFFGNSVTGPWTQIGNTIDLGFGNLPVYLGMGVSSRNATIASTAVFTNVTENSSVVTTPLLNFTATNERNLYVALAWQTSMKEDIDHFEIQRSTNATDFTTILQVKAVGDSTVIQSYSTNDNTPVRGINFYHLKQVDTAGKFIYSPTAMVKFGTGISPLIYPNPVSTVFTAVPGSELIREIVIYNVEGRAVQFAVGNSTSTEMKVNVSLLPKGVYFLKVKTDSQIYKFKLERD
jgi:F5/8 type C domain/Secretion system C-terminal sorting domain/Fibronectin type III domain